MGLANCKRCGRLYHAVHTEICPACIKEDDELFFKVRDYLDKNRGAHMYQVSEDTEIPVSTIIRFIREGRISVEKNPHLNFPCESCGTPIQVGRFCRSCKERLQSGFESTKEHLSSGKQQQKNGLDYLSKRFR